MFLFSSKWSHFPRSYKEAISRQNQNFRFYSHVFIHTASTELPWLLTHFSSFLDDIDAWSIHDGGWQIGLSLWPWTSAKEVSPPAFPPQYTQELDGDAYLTSLANVLQAVPIPVTVILVLTPLIHLLSIALSPPKCFSQHSLNLMS